MNHLAERKTQLLTAAYLHEKKADYWLSKDSAYGREQAERERAAADYCREKAATIDALMNQVLAHQMTYQEALKAMSLMDQPAVALAEE